MSDYPKVHLADLSKGRYGSKKKKKTNTRTHIALSLFYFLLTRKYHFKNVLSLFALIDVNQ